MARLLLGLFLAIAVPPGGAETYLINPEGTGDFETIQEAIAAALDDDVIELTDGTFTGDGNRDLDYLGKAITIRSQSGNPQDCILDCQANETDPHVGVYFRNHEGPAAVLSGVSITNGWSADQASGVLCQQSSPTIESCIFSANVGNEGGAMVCDSSSCTITNVAFIENTATRGTGIMGNGGSFPSITGCSFSGNYASSEGAAICCFLDASPTVTECTFYGNVSQYHGGAVRIGDFSVAVFLRCTFAGNSAGYQGGAANCCAPTVLFRNCTFYGNSAGNGGGALVCGCSSDVTLENSILAFSTQGEAVHCWSNGSATLSCCDVYGNAGGDWVDCIAGQEGQDGNICADPLFCDPDGGDFTLHGSSPCLTGHHPEGYDCGLMGTWPVGCPPGAVDDEDGELARPRLLHAAPNPFCGSTRITFATCGGAVAAPSAPSAPVTVGIYDPAGRLIRALVNAPQADGVHTVCWDGTDRDGKPAPAGAYFCRIRLRAHTEAAPVILAR